MTTTASSTASTSTANQTDAAAEPHYVYCIFRSSIPTVFETRGMGKRGDLVHAIQYRDLAAAVSASPVSDYENTRRNMMRHMRVLEEVIHRHAILPVRFDSVAPSPSAIRDRLLAARYDELMALLELIEDRVEIGVKASWSEKEMLAEMLHKNAPIRQLRDSLANRSATESHYERIRLGTMVEAALAAQREATAGQILQRLRPLADETKLNDTLLDTIFLNAAFLVQRCRELAFETEVRAIDDDVNGRYLLKCIGPVPPYNFVNVALRWDD